MSEFTVLNVGHGNSSVLTVDNKHYVFDCGRNSTYLYRYLTSKDIETLEAIYISHSDMDHVNGLYGVLEAVSLNTFHVPCIYMNEDQQKESKFWKRVNQILQEVIHTQNVQQKDLTCLSETHVTGSVHLEFSAPHPDLLARGVNGKTPHNYRIRPNTLSAVIRIKTPELNVLLPGDLDHAGFIHWLKQTKETDRTADVLIFPHHGGRPRANRIQEYAQNWIQHTCPQMILFSIAPKPPHKGLLPRTEIIEGLQQNESTKPHIACTGFSKGCTLTEDNSSNTKSCAIPNVNAEKQEEAGHIRFDLSKTAMEQDWFSPHQQFVSKCHSTLCGGHSTKSD